MKENNRSYRAVVFDLDGTLLDTLTDLANSVNAVLGNHGMPQYTEEQIRSFVGNGIRMLLKRTVPDGEENPEFSSVFEEFKIYYGVHCMDETEPYPGIIALLEQLKKQGYRTAIVSNKADFAVKKLSRVYFGELIDVAIGEREGCRRKPAPDSVLQALEELGIPKEDAVYVGDSDVDLETAKNAGTDCIAVTWGFRSRAFLMEHGAVDGRMAANAAELFKLLEKTK